MAEEKSRGCLGTFLAIIGVLAIIVVGIVVFVQCNSNGNNSGTSSNGSGNSGGGSSSLPQITYRDANNGDISGDWDSSLFDQKFVFIPKYNISNLEFTFLIKNKNDQVIKTITKTIGNVTKGQQYTVTLTTTDLGDLGTMWNARTTYLEVTGGRVALF